MSTETSKLEEEIDSWKGFGNVMKREDLELYNAMIKDVREFAGAVQAWESDLTTDPFFMVLLLAQQKIINRLKDELKGLRAGVPDTPTTSLTLDSYTPDG